MCYLRKYFVICNHMIARKSQAALMTQVIVLTAGTLFAWFSVAMDFIRFYHNEGTVFKVVDCVAPNPVMTPCFYGAFCFLGALIWAIKIQQMEPRRQAAQQRWLTALILGGVIFAWSNFTYQAIKFYSAPIALGVSCSGVPTSSPFLTPCFYGSVLFTLSLAAAIWTYRMTREE